MSKANFIKIPGLSFLTILFLCLSFPPADVGYLAWIAFIPWFILIVTEERYAYINAMFIGTVFIFIQLSWLRHVTYIAWILLSLYCAAYFLVFAFCSRFIIFRLRLPLVVVAPCIWTALEFIRSFLLSGFPWFFIGHTQYTYLPVIQICDITGVYGVSFIIIMINACIADLIIYGFTKRNLLIRETEKRRNGETSPVLPISDSPRLRFSHAEGSDKNPVEKGISTGQYYKCLFPGQRFIFYGLTCILPFVLFTASLCYGFYWLNNYRPLEGPTLCMVQGNIPQEVKFESNEEDEISILKKYTDLSLSIKGEQIDLLVWPETMVPGLLNIDPELTGRKIDVLSQLAPIQLSQELNTNILLGGIALILNGEEQRYFNSAYYYNTEGKFVNRYDKIHLVPFGEFTPLKNYFPFLASLVPYEIGLTHGHCRTLFRLNTTQHGSFVFGSSICYEDTVPSLIRKFKKGGADFMLNITNDGWFRNSAELDQHLAIMVFRAVENRFCMARAANTGISSFVSPDGAIYAKLSDSKGKYREISGTLTDRIKLVEKYNPFYTTCGDWFSILCVAASLIMLIMSIFKGRIVSQKVAKPKLGMDFPLDIL